MTAGMHGAGCVFRNSGNDGSASISEDAAGRIMIRIYGDPATLAKMIISINDDQEIHLSWQAGALEARVRELTP